MSKRKDFTPEARYAMDAKQRDLEMKGRFMGGTRGKSPIKGRSKPFREKVGGMCPRCDRWRNVDEWVCYADAASKEPIHRRCL